MRHRYSNPRWLLGLLAAASVAVLSACDTSQTPTAPEAAPTVVFGKVSAAPTTAAAASSTSMGGILVTTEDEAATSTTDENGAFRLEVRSDDGRVRIRFRRGGLDVRLELSGLPEGGVFQVDVSLSDADATVLNSSDSGETDFDGHLVGLSVAGDAPTRVARLDVRDDDESFIVDVREDATTFDADEDVGTFDELLDAFADTASVLEVDGEGRLQADGTIVADHIEIENDHSDDENDADSDDDSDDDGNDDGNDDEDFEGTASLVEVSGDAPSRTARIEITNLVGTLTIDVVEGSTTFDPLGDAVTFDEMLSALNTESLTVEIEGDGDAQSDGTVVATSVRVETDSDDDGNDDEDFEGTASLVEVSGDAPSRTARIEVTNVVGTLTIDVVEGSTTFDPLGDAVTFDEMLSALNTEGLTVEIEGDGDTQSDGTVVATSVKVETDR